MTSTAQRAELQAKIWRIANDVRGSVDGWDFKHFVLGTLFYRFISENFTKYIEADDESIDYSKLSDDVITPEIKDDAIKTKGYFIYPSQLFLNVSKKANTNPNLNTDLKATFDAIESSANGYPSEPDIKGLFADFDTTSTRLGNTVESKNNTLAKVLKGIEELNFGNFEDNQIDLFGDAYEFLIGNYAQNAGKSGGKQIFNDNLDRHQLRNKKIMTNTQLIIEILKLFISLLTPILVVIIGLKISKKLEKNKLDVLKEKEWQVKWAELFLKHATKFNDNISDIIREIYYLQYQTEQVNIKEKYEKIKLKQIHISGISWNIRNYTQFSEKYGKDVISTQQTLIDNIQEIMKEKKCDLESFRMQQFEYNTAVRNAHREILKM